MPQHVHFDIRHHDDFIELRLADTTFYDVPSYAELHDSLVEFVEQQQPVKLVISFDRIRYCSTALINGVLIAQNRMLQWGGELKLCGMSATVRDAFRMLRLDGSIFNIYGTSSEALAAF